MIDAQKAEAVPAFDLAADPMTATPELDELVAEAWRTVLGLETVEPFYDFYGCGGHSLHALRIVHTLRRQLDLDIDLVLLLNSNNLADFTETLREKLRTGAPRRAPISRAGGPR
ncbi:hypothetical protein ABIA33_001365 [Streptacidiphilus sp. MAP12-16]|uniref:phosphopantetheine-binding protein n=1 Tax=Streptacidiphilus sp. MAP12-16 TaxID=3156300 RepID=UPI0035148E14